MVMVNQTVTCAETHFEHNQQLAGTSCKGGIKHNWCHANCIKMCTLRNEDIIALRCITTKAMNTNNVFIFAFGFLRHGC